MSYQRPNNRQIITDLETALERIRQLEDEAGLDCATDPKFGFTASEDAMLGLLINSRATLTRNRVYDVMYGIADDPPEMKIIDVWVSRIRSKLKAHGVDVNIQTVWGRGYFLEPADRQKLAEAVLQVPQNKTEAA